jgi:hypothetical protein
MPKSTVRRLGGFASLLAVVTSVVSPAPSVLGGQSGEPRATADGRLIPLAEASNGAAPRSWRARVGAGQKGGQHASRV